MGQSDESGEHKARIGRLVAGQILLGSGSDSSAISYAVEQRGAQQISAMRHRVGSGRSKLVEIPERAQPGPSPPSGAYSQWSVAARIQYSRGGDGGHTDQESQPSLRDEEHGLTSRSVRSHHGYRSSAQVRRADY